MQLHLQIINFTAMNETMRERFSIVTLGPILLCTAAWEAGFLIVAVAREGNIS